MTSELSRFAGVLAVLFMSPALPAPAADDWEGKTLETEFFAEGATAGDITGDGRADLVYGPFWFTGPGFGQRHRFADGEPFSVRRYSDNFFSFVRDFDGDGNNDILVLGFPGKEARLHLHPGKGRETEKWPMHIIADQVCHEAPDLVDLIPGGLPEIVCSRDTCYGYYRAGEDPVEPWTWHAISAEREAAKPFGHGMGVGDINGDGRLDIVDRMFWFEQPRGADIGDPVWEKHRWAPEAYGGGAQILVHDVDADGDADLITSLQAHGHGIAWFEQVEGGQFVRHDILGDSSTDSPYGVCFSQPHGMALADIDNDGMMDFVTGKRWYAHNGKDPGGHQPAVLYWFRATRGKGNVEFVPHFVDDDSGVGVGVTVADLNGDGRLDIVSGNKKGLTIHLQESTAASGAARRWKTDDARPQDDYGVDLSAAEAIGRMEVPEGFSVDLVAAEPDLVQPIAMCFDARGRIWVVEGNTYPERAPDGEGRDRILIFEDSDADGSFETRRVFAESINLASGIEVGFGGVYVGAAPHLLFYPDRDRDDRPDGEAVVLLDGWGYQDTHETLNSFTWGPDGWLYGCHGVFTHSRVGKPGTPDEKREPLNAGVWRYHPTRHEFEVFAHGTSNPWGLDFNETGDCFISTCVIPHFFHIVQGGRYIRQAGQHFNPYTFTEIDTIADHAHYAGSIREHAFWGPNKAARPAAPTSTSVLGGGHAHCGLALYLADRFPPRYRGDAFFHNLHGHRILQEHLEADGSSYTARHRPDFLFANNHDFIGVGVMLGPDGALYFSDWVDAQTCHHRDVAIWNRTNGRIFRVRYGENSAPAIDLHQEDNAMLANRLADPNAFIARQARRILQERSAGANADPGNLARLLRDFETRHAGNRTLRLRAFWTMHACRLLRPADYLRRLADPDEHVRGWALQFLGEAGAALPEESLAAVTSLARDERSLVTRRYLASLLQRLPVEQRWEVATRLVTDAPAGKDRLLPRLVWYALEPVVEADPARAFDLAGRNAWPELPGFIARRAAISPAGRSALMTFLTRSRNADEFVRRSQQLLGALAQLPPVERPAGWEEARKKGESLGTPAVTDALRRMGVRFGDPAYFPFWRTVAGSGTTPAAQRVKAIELLQAGSDPELGNLARESLAVPALRRAAINALRNDPGEATATAIVLWIAKFPLKLRNDAINLLATRPDMALVLLRAVDGKKIDAALVSPVLLDQFERFGDERLDALIRRNWSRGATGIDPAEYRVAVSEWKARLNPRTLAGANASRGRAVYDRTCGTCHQLFGEGIALGPDLTGSNRADLGYLLENVLAPSAVVGRDYLLHVFTMNDGTVVSGMVTESTPEFIKVAMPGGSFADVKVSEIREREEMAQSLMPPGLFDTLPLAQVADLVKYLASPNQVPLPGGPKPPATPIGGTPAGAGVVRLEGEALLSSVEASGGNVRAQPMKGFGPHWSGDAQLFWIGGKPSDTLTITLPGVTPGTHDVSIVPTTARDYARIKVLVAGHLATADLYGKSVLPGEPVRFNEVSVSPSEPLRIVITVTGRHPDALPRHMVGIDHIELRRRP